jgi:hypothetical protein
MFAQRTLDTSRPYATVFGLPGADFQQDGILFNASGRAVTEGDTMPITDGDAAPRPVVQSANIGDAKPFGTAPIEQPFIQKAAPAPEYAPNVKEPTPEELWAQGYIHVQNLNWKALQQLVIQAGGKWSNKEDAYAFLSKIDLPKQVPTRTVA